MGKISAKQEFEQIRALIQSGSRQQAQRRLRELQQSQDVRVSQTAAEWLTKLANAPKSRRPAGRWKWAALGLAALVVVGIGILFAYLEISRAQAGTQGAQSVQLLTARSVLEIDCDMNTVFSAEYCQRWAGRISDDWLSTCAQRFNPTSQRRPFFNCLYDLGVDFAWQLER